MRRARSAFRRREADLDRAREQENSADRHEQNAEPRFILEMPKAGEEKTGRQEDNRSAQPARAEAAETDQPEAGAESSCQQDDVQ